MLNRFSRWFASAGGVWQTVIGVGLVIVLEYAHVIHDDSMFQLMAWLTIYSAVTQPVLAYTNRQESALLDKIEKLEEMILNAIQERSAATSVTIDACTCTPAETAETPSTRNGPVGLV